MLRRKAKCGTNCVMTVRNDDSTEHDNRQTSGSKVPTETGQTAYKRELAYRRLGINQKDVNASRSLLSSCDVLLALFVGTARMIQLSCRSGRSST